MKYKGHDELTRTPIEAEEFYDFNEYSLDKLLYPLFKPGIFDIESYKDDLRTIEAGRIVL